MKRAALYARVSTDIQAKEGDSISAQLDALKKYVAERPNLTCAGVFVDDGISGTRMERDELQRLLEAVEAGKIDVILVTKMDRLHRSLRNFLNMQELLDRKGVSWLAIWEPMYDSSTPQGRMIINSMMNLAQFEAENTGQRINQVFAYKVQKGEVLSGNQPPGYSIKDKHLVLNEDAPMVKEAFEYYSHHCNLNGTVEMLASKYDRHQEKHVLKAMFQNTKYIGLFRGNPHYCPPIVSEELFMDVNRKLAMNTTHPKRHEYLFKGMVRCAECGRMMSAYYMLSHGRKGRKYHYNAYRCTVRYNRLEKGICDNGKIIHERVLERYLLENVRSKCEEYIMHAEEMHAKAADHSKQISALERKIARLKELYINELITMDEYRADLDAFKAEIEALRAEESLVSLPNLGMYRNILSDDFEEMYEHMSFDEKRYFWQEMVKEIWFGKDRHFEVKFF